MNKLDQQSLMLQSIANMTFIPEPTTLKEPSPDGYRLPLSRMTALGVGWEPVVAAIQRAASGGKAVGGYYKVTIPSGTQLAKFRAENAFSGTAMGAGGIEAQARLNPLVCDPTMLFLAAALANIDRKLDTIQETQREMMEFLVQKEKSELKGDLDFLTDVFNNYKYNWNNEKYKSANHLKALDIRQNAGRKVDFYRELIQRQIAKRKLIHIDQDVKKMLEKVADTLEDYQIALYLYGFSYFIEVLLQENFDANYLSSIANKVELLSLQYRELYTSAYTQLEAHKRTSVQEYLLNGLSIANKVAGEAIAKIPAIGDSQLDEKLINNSAKIRTYKEKRSVQMMSQLRNHKDSCVRPFIEQINAINQIYNHPLTLTFNNETLVLTSN